MNNAFNWKAVLSTKRVLSSPRKTKLSVEQRMVQTLRERSRHQQGPAMMEEGATA